MSEIGFRVHSISVCFYLWGSWNPSGRQLSHSRRTVAEAWFGCELFLVENFVPGKDRDGISEADLLRANAAAFERFEWETALLKLWLICRIYLVIPIACPVIPPLPP
jgi:hypothetical protein